MGLILPRSVASLSDSIVGRFGQRSCARRAGLLHAVAGGVGPFLVAVGARSLARIASTSSRSSGWSFAGEDRRGAGDMRGGHRGAADRRVAAVLPGRADADAGRGHIDVFAVVAEGGEGVIRSRCLRRSNEAFAAWLAVVVGQGRDGDHVGARAEGRFARRRRARCRRRRRRRRPLRPIGERFVERRDCRAAPQPMLMLATSMSFSGSSSRASPVTQSTAGDRSSDGAVALVVEHPHRPRRAPGATPTTPSPLSSAPIVPATWVP